MNDKAYYYIVTSALNKLNLQPEIISRASSIQNTLIQNTWMSSLIVYFQSKKEWCSLNQP